MHITVLAATGALGRRLTAQALTRGHAVTAVARNPLSLPDADGLTRIAADVFDPGGIARALEGSTVVLSGLGVTDRPGTLTAGAKAVVAAKPERVIWIGAFGTGPSALYAGPLLRTLLGTFMRGELPDKVTADATVLDAGGTLLHAGPLSDTEISKTRRLVPLVEAPRRLFPARVSRATVAALMLDEAESATPRAGVLIPLA